MTRGDANYVLGYNLYPNVVTIQKLIIIVEAKKNLSGIYQYGYIHRTFLFFLCCGANMNYPSQERKNLNDASGEDCRHEVRIHLVMFK